MQSFAVRGDLMSDGREYACLMPGAPAASDGRQLLKTVDRAEITIVMDNFVDIL